MTPKAIIDRHSQAIRESVIIRLMQKIEDKITALQDEKAQLQAELDAIHDTRPESPSTRHYGGIIQ